MPRKAAQTLSDATLRGAKPQAKGDRKLHDGRCSGLACRIRPTGRREFIFTTAVAGRRFELPLGEFVAAPAGSGAERARELAALPPWAPAPRGLTLSEARTLADRVRAFVRLGGDPVAERESERKRRTAPPTEAPADGVIPGTFRDLAARWLAYQRRERRQEESVRGAELLIERDLFPTLADRPAGEVTRADLAEIAAAVAEGHGARRKRPGRPAPVAARNVVKTAGRIFGFGIDTDFAGVTGNPAARIVRRLGTAKRRDRVLSPAELRAFWQATETEPATSRAFPRLLLLSGLRRDELLGARWQEIERDEFGTWLAVPGERMKGGSPHRAPLSRLALAELETLAEYRAGDFLFPGRYGPAAPMREAFYFRQRLAAKVTARLAEPVADPRAWTWHDLRRTARTLLSEAGAAEVPSELLLAHTPPALRGVAGAYNRHAYRAELQAVAELLAERVRRIVEDAAPASVLPFARKGA